LEVALVRLWLELRGPHESQAFLPEEVWHEKLTSPFDFWRGMPPLAVAVTAARTDHPPRSS